MTAIQVNYQNYLENQRHNLEMEHIDRVNAALKEKELKLKGIEADIADRDVAAKEKDANTRRMAEFRQQQLFEYEAYGKLGNFISGVAKGIEALNPLKILFG